MRERERERERKSERERETGREREREREISDCGLMRPRLFLAYTGEKENFVQNFQGRKRKGIKK